MGYVGACPRPRQAWRDPQDHPDAEQFPCGLIRWGGVGVPHWQEVGVSAPAFCRRWRKANAISPRRNAGRVVRGTGP